MKVRGILLCEVVPSLFHRSLGIGDRFAGLGIQSRDDEVEASSWLKDHSLGLQAALTRAGGDEGITVKGRIVVA